MKAFSVSLTLCTFLILSDAYWFDPNSPNFKLGGLCEQMRNQSQTDTVTDNATFSRRQTAVSIGEFVPQCDGNGNFLPQQCSGSTGYCWCVNVITGKEIPNTKTPPGVTPVQCGLCEQERNQSQGLIGEFVPQCDANGNFFPQQCWASTGYCWCVNIITGKEIPNTKTRPGVTPVQCGLCKQERKSSQDRPGEFVPQCDANGNFLPQQCWASTGYCWCINIITGKEILNTRTPPGVTPVQCGLCEQERKHSQDRIGEFVPKCDVNGNFLPQQCSGSTGYCWCVDVITGNEIPNTKTRPGVTPVQCGKNSCPKDWSRIGKRCFIFIDSPKTWSEAEGYCLFEGANLASVHSNEENNIIQILTKGDTHKFPLTWIGGNDCIQSGFWMWSDGTKFNYENWSTKVDYNMEDKRRTMHCLEMNYGYRKKWNAASCNDTLPFVCAKEI